MWVFCIEGSGELGSRVRLPEALHNVSFLRHLRSQGSYCYLQDHYDVKMPCHLLLSKLAAKAGGHVVAALDTICRPLEKTLTSKLKQDAVKQEVSSSSWQACA